MARKNKKNKDNEQSILEDYSPELMVEEEPRNRLVSAIIILLIIFIWLGIFAVVVKTDIGGFGSTVMAPMLKDVPVLNKILPDSVVSDKKNDYNYKSMADAVDYIKQLETELATYQKDDTDKEQTIAQLQAEVERLKAFETAQEQFEKDKQEYYDEVVFGDNAIDYDNYVKYYQQISPESAEELYKKAVEKYAYDEEFTERAKMYSSMDPAEAAATFYEMTGDMDIVANILNAMSTTNSSAIMNEIAALDSVYAAKLTKLLLPQ